MIQVLKKLAWMTVTLILSGINCAAFADIPKGMMIVGYDGTGWFPYINDANANGWLKLTGIQDPAYLSWQPGSGHFMIKGNDGKLYQYQLDTKAHKPLTSFDKTNYTQLRSFKDGFVMVELLEGKSSDTRIVFVDNEHKTEVAVRQASAQFHPYRHDDHLYYAHVSCRLECKPLIQEVWQKDLVTGLARQLTLLNATSYLYSVDPEGRYGYISSNQKGYCHLARLDLSSGEVSWLTDGHVTDSFPSIARDGSLYFIRRTPAGSQLMRIAKASALQHAVNPGEALELVPLPEDIKKIRYLELND